MIGNVRDASREKINSIQRKGDAIMKNVIKAVIECSVVCFAVWLIIHRHVISACITGDEMPEAPEWHKKCFKNCKS